MPFWNDALSTVFSFAASPVDAANESTTSCIAARGTGSE
jgi:hypothetical protein